MNKRTFAGGGQVRKSSLNPCKIRKTDIINNIIFKDVKEFNIIFLILIGIFLVSISGYSSYAIFSDEIVSNNEIKGTIIGKNIEPNAPLLSDNMIPVYYDESSDAWRKADINNANNSWYDYDSKKWANAVTVYDETGCSNSKYESESECKLVAYCSTDGEDVLGQVSGFISQYSKLQCQMLNGIFIQRTARWHSSNRKTYLDAPVGTIIPTDDINAMFVWIPRYKYTYFSNTKESEINIKFEKGTNSTGTINCQESLNSTDEKGNAISEICTDKTNGGLIEGVSTYTHPAFTFGSDELTGIWVGKFSNSIREAPNSGSINKDTKTITIIPIIEAFSWTPISIVFESIRNMELANNIYGFSQTSSTVSKELPGKIENDSNNLDTHLMKSMEWGAVAYLSQSKYGIGKEVYANNSGDMYTGMSAGTPKPSNFNALEDMYAYNGRKFYFKEYSYNNGGYSYPGTYESISDKSLGFNASTTGNIYGIYDMNGKYETVMGNIHAEPDIFAPGEKGNGKWTGSYKPDEKYYTKYSYGSNWTIGRLGDATKEIITSNNKTWYNGIATKDEYYDPWITRSDSSSKGLFSFSNMSGDAFANTTRTTLVIK